ncbi:MAG TPA: signal recognition particle-docking protein FtsY [Nanoarchaeota archaeon]|nr:signal recognition particle-docking protein FtsY [Nanoarchaeota archaeon]
MFKFLKEKLKSAIGRISSAIEKDEPVGREMEAPLPPPEETQTEQEIIEEFKEEIPEPPKEEKPAYAAKIEEPKKEEKRQEQPKVQPPFVKVKHFEEKKEDEKETPKKEEPKKEIVKGAPKKEEPVQEEKKGFFSRLKQAIATTKISSEKFDELFWELELAMLENNVAFEVIEKIKADLKRTLVEKPIARGRVEDAVAESLRESIASLFEDEKKIDLLHEIKKGKKPYIVSFLGANGSGKTTTIAKIAYMLQSKGLKCVLAAGDTWRSAAIQQLEQHANSLNVPIVKQDYGADPAAVAYDAIEMAKARNIDVVLIDTAGRQHSNANLMDEMKKIVRVAKPDMKVYIGEMIAGNDCIEQIQSFDEAVGIDGVILSKADIDEKGGTAISVTYVTKKPILYLGMGQEYRDLEVFDKDKILKGLGL